MKTAIYPGSFDPITNGHIDILKRALKVFDKIIILVANNPDKKSRFSMEDRLNMAKEAVSVLNGVEVDTYDGLTIDYAKKHDACALIRGLRAVTDFEYEFQLSSINKFINDSIETVFFMATDSLSFISSSQIIAMHKEGIDVSSLVPESVTKRLK